MNEIINKNSFVEIAYIFMIVYLPQISCTYNKIWNKMFLYILNKIIMKQK